ncbi:MAG: hypothetical protein K9G33_07040, partial [Sneathiella sp.]|nr:hypothetical protein [Sneathiella sp.]
IELSMGMFINSVVEGSLKDASRLGLTGQISGTTGNKQGLVDIINDATLGMIGLTTDDVTTLVYDDFASVGKGEPLVIDVNGNGSWDEADGDTFTDVNGNLVWDEDLGVAGLGSAGSIVLYTVEYNWNFLSGQVIPILGGIIPMRASIVVRNEPYTTGGSGSGT